MVKGKRIIVAIHCRVDAGSIMGGSHYDDYYDYYDDEEDEEEGPIEECGDGLLELLIDVRKCLMKGQFRPLYAVWDQYGEDDDQAPPKPKKRGGAQTAKNLAFILCSV